VATGFADQGYADGVSYPNPFRPWTRPTDWLALTDPTGGQEKIVILAAVQPSDSYLAFTISGAYTVDWGDGAGTVNFAAGDKASKVLSWSSYSSGTLTTRGYRQAIITITPQAGQQLTSLNFSTAHASPPSSASSTTILDMVVSAPNCQLFALGTNGTAQTHRMIERFRWVGTNLIVTWDYVFNLCSSLRTFAATNGQGYDIWMGSAITAGSAFQNMSSLEVGPALYTTSALTVTQSMFASNGAMRSIPIFNTSGVTSGIGMFQNCTALTTVPAFDWTSLANASSMFLGCAALTFVPPSSPMNALSTLSQTFQSCSNLQAAPSWDYSKVTSLNAAFNSCSMLTDTSALGHATKGITSVCTDMSSAFYSCRALTSVAAMNTSGVTAMSWTFHGCSSLQSIPTPSGNLWKTSAVTIWTNTFASCLSLQTIPLLDTSAATNMSNMFNSCTALSSVPGIDVANCTNFSQTFSSCVSLQSAPLAGGRFSISYASCLLNAAALDAIYTALGTASGSQTITVTSNPGIATDTPSIATAKGWTVTGS